MAKIKYLILFLFIFGPIQAAHAEPISTALGISMAATYVLVASAALAAIGTATSITMGVIQTNQAKAQANYQRQVNEQNARKSREAAQAKIENQRRAAKFTYGTQLARLGGMGALAEGSPLDIMGQSAGQNEYDMMVTEYEGETQAIQFQQQAALNKYQADIADYNLGLNTTATVIKGASSIGNSILGATGGLGGGVNKNAGDFTTSSGGSIDLGKDYLTGNMVV